MEQGNQNPTENTGGAGPNGAPAPGAQSPAPKKDSLMIVLTYILFFIPLITEDKNDPFFKYHARQSLGILLCSIANSILAHSLLIFLTPLIAIFLFVVWIIGLLSALKGEQKPVPVIGQLFEKINWF